jgi:hypothetical protein
MSSSYPFIDEHLHSITGASGIDWGIEVSEGPVTTNVDTASQPINRKTILEYDSTREQLTADYLEVCLVLNVLGVSDYKLLHRSEHGSIPSVFIQPIISYVLARGLPGTTIGWIGQGARAHICVFIRDSTCNRAVTGV